jgi:hypothetical protein
MMKNKSTLAKLLAEEDIFVVHKQMETAYFDSKKRELGLPIWKDEDMTPDIYDLMVGHEIGHALWTPLDMLEKAAVRKINHGFVNIIEDARIEKKGKQKYPGLVGVFNRGYIGLIKNDFFGTAKKNVNALNLIDKINIFFKTADTNIVFSDEEKIWVKRVAKTETPDEVLDLAEELYAWMEENESKTDNHDSGEDGSDMTMPGDGDASNEETSENGEKSDDKSDDADDGKSDETSNNDGSDGNSKAGDEDKSEDGGTGSSTDSEGSGEDEVESKSTDSDTDTTEGGESSTGKSGPPVAETDSASKNGLDALRDKGAENRIYARIPKVDLKEIIVDTDTLLKEWTQSYLIEKSKDHQKGLYFDKTFEEVEALKSDSKSTVAYMAKEFEMKKAADQYARASTSKTGSLDMNKLHTYKYNEDLFKKVTTLPGATNHGMVMVLDWSGSMSDNLKGTLAQMYNLIWFCRRTNIPFEVFAFSDVYASGGRNSYRCIPDLNEVKSFKAGDIAVHENFRLLNIFSSNISLSNEMSMMHILWMYACRFYRGYRDWSECGHPYSSPESLSLGGTPLNDAIIAMMDLVPQFKKDAGVQKVNTIFLTDGASNRLEGVYDYRLITDDNDERKGTHERILSEVGSRKTKTVMTDPVMNKTIEVENSSQITNSLLQLLKNRVPGMNIVGFFIAGSGKSGRVDKRTLYYLLEDRDWTKIQELIKLINKNKYLALNQLGYDEYYVLPGGNNLQVENETLSDDLVGAAKGKLKTAFGKMQKNKISSRQLLNKFVKMVA